MNPNDLSRISLGMSPIFLRNLYQFIIFGEYRCSTYKWRKGTGGGPGYPKDYHQWNLKDAILFTNYGGGKGIRVKKGLPSIHING